MTDKNAEIMALAERIAAYLDDAPTEGRHSDKAGANAYELLIEAADELRSSAALPPESADEPVAWRVTAGGNSERHIFEEERYAKLMRKDLEENGWLDVKMAPLYLRPARPSAETASVREALDNSQSLLAMIDHFGADSAAWIAEDVADLLTKQIVDNRTALHTPARQDAVPAESVRTALEAARSEACRTVHASHLQKVLVGFDLAAEAALSDPAPVVAPADILWCCHARGPDDVYAAPDYATALTWSDILNDSNWNHRQSPASYKDCLIKATPAAWPHSAEAHSADMPKSITGFTRPEPTLTIDSIPSCGQENDYRRAMSAMERDAATAGKLFNPSPRPLSPASAPAEQEVVTEDELSDWLFSMVVGDRFIARNLLAAFDVRRK